MENVENSDSLWLADAYKQLTDWWGRALCLPSPQAGSWGRAQARLERAGTFLRAPVATLASSVHAVWPRPGSPGYSTRPESDPQPCPVT